VFVLVPVEQRETKPLKVKAGAKDRAVAHDGGLAVTTTPEATTLYQERAFRRGVYRSTLHHKANPEKLPLSETRLKVLKVIHKAGKKPLRAKDIMKKTNLPHGSIQQTLNWLRHHDAECRVDTDPKFTAPLVAATADKATV
jgi:hypothetical protein